MIKGTLNTRTSDAGGTFGELVCSKPTGETFCAETTERPPTGDHPCIPGKVYTIKLLNHPEHGWCFEIMDVEGRTAILIHAANVWQQLLGCIALGKTVTQFGKDACHLGMPPVNTYGVTDSKNTIQAFMEFMGTEDWELTIIR